MKKFSIVVILALMSFAALAQDESTTESVVLKSKRGVSILPEAGEWGLGISANPFLTYAGNSFNGRTFNNAPSFDYVNNPTNNIAIFGKYIVDTNTAYRVRFNASINTTIDKAVISQNELAPDPFFPAFTEDWRKSNRKAIVVAAGYEKRRGSSRVQGIYGGELVMGYSSLKQTYEYGNPISADFNVPITNNFGGNILAGGARKTEEKFGNILSIGARGFLGVEYFIGPKISLGAEFGYSFAFNSVTRGLLTSERWYGTTNSVLVTKSDVNNSGYSSFMGTSLDNLNGSINLLFYF